MEYITSAQFGMISYWLVERNMEIPISELGILTKEISLHGPVGFMKMKAGARETEQPGYSG